MKKTLLILGISILAGFGLYAKVIYPMLVADCYARSPGGSCIRVVNMGYCLSGDWQVSSIGTQARLKGSDGTVYTLWEDYTCGTSPLYYR